MGFGIVRFIEPTMNLVRAASRMPEDWTDASLPDGDVPAWRVAMAPHEGVIIALAVQVAQGRKDGLVGDDFADLSGVDVEIRAEVAAVLQVIDQTIDGRFVAQSVAAAPWWLPLVMEGIRIGIELWRNRNKE